MHTWCTPVRLPFTPRRQVPTSPNNMCCRRDTSNVRVALSHGIARNISFKLALQDIITKLRYTVRLVNHERARPTTLEHSYRMANELKLSFVVTVVGTKNQEQWR